MKQLEAADLRIGNYISHPRAEIDRVEEIVCKEVKEGKQYACKFENSHAGYFLSHKGEALIKGIPLTPEILKKMGFKTRTTETHSVQYFIGINPITKDWLFDILWLDRDEFPFYRNGYFKLKFVHQLQNLYHALTQEELEFEL